MNVLIDTQILIWIQENNPAISLKSRAVLTSLDNQVYVPQISFFEIAIKRKIGKLPAFQLTTDELVHQAIEDGIHILPLGDHHIAAYDQIPLHADHRDPFDRLILATALAEKMPVISADGHFHRYSDIVEIIW